METKKKYFGIIKFNNDILHSFEENDRIYSIAKIVRLVSEEYPYALGEVIDLKSKKIIHKCKKSPVC